jgi:3-hydroxypropanoate dehydrogenase
MSAVDRSPMDGSTLDRLFRNARSHNGWLPTDVPNPLLREIHNLARMGPTSMNCCPMRVVFIRSAHERTRILPAVNESNREKIGTAPVIAVIGYDRRFYEHMPRLFPHRPERRETFAADPALAEETAFRNGTLQGAWLMLAARAVGLDCGPISGFDRRKLDDLMFSGTTVTTNFLCGLGYGDPSHLMSRLPRFGFDDVCRIV